MKLNHNQKVKLARSMRTHAELVARTPIFQTKAWIRRSAGIEAGIMARPSVLKQRAERRAKLAQVTT